MHTVLGSNGQIGTEVARELRQRFDREVRLVSRRPRPVSARDELVPADLLDPAQTHRAVEGSEVVYLTAGLPLDTQLWVEQWPVLMRNVIAACAAHGAKLVFFDNTYMYPQTAEPQSEATEFRPHGPKGEVRGAIARELLDAIASGRVEGLIGRAPEFYGPAQTQSVTTSMVIDPLWAGKTAKVLVSADTRRSLIYTPDASRALALLGNTPDAFGRTWHLPVDPERPTYRQLVERAAATFGVVPKLRVLRPWQLRLAGLVSRKAQGAAELLPRYGVDNLFVADSFTRRFPDFRVTTIDEGLGAIRDERRAADP